MRGAFVLLVLLPSLLAMALAGCSGANDGDESDTTPTTSAGPVPTTAAPTPSPQPNRAPILDLRVSNKTGTEPLTVTLLLNASDLDGDALAWTLNVSSNTTFAANGTSLPAQVNVTLAAGNHTFTAVVSDGKGNATASLLVAVLPAIAGPWQLESGAIEGHGATCAAGPYDATLQGFVKIAILPETIGLDYTVTLRAGSAYDGVVWLDGSDAEISHTLLGITEGGWELAGTVPDGAAALALVACGNTFDETYVYHAGDPPVEIPAP